MAGTSSAASDRCDFTDGASNEEETMDQHTAEHPFETGLDRRPANFVPLSPISFLRSSVASFRDKIAVIDGERTFTYGQLNERCVRLASALAARGIGRLDT